MAKTIKCPQCNGKGYKSKQKKTIRYPDGRIEIIEVIEHCPNPNCHEGVIIIDTDKK